MQWARLFVCCLWTKLWKSVDRCVCVCRLCIPEEGFEDPGRRHPRWGTRKEEKFLLLVSHWPTYLIPPWGLCRRDGLLELHKLCLGSQVGAGFRRTLLSHPGVISTPLPHTPAESMQPHKALFMPGGWPGAPEGGWGRRGGSCTRGQGTSGTHLGRPATAALCSGLDTR